MGARALRTGISGWLCALLPLVVVNTLGYLGLLSTVEAVLAGAVTLVGSPLIGGAVVGLLGGRPEEGYAGGAAGTLLSAAVAGGLYLASLLGLVVAAAELDAEPELLAAHPIRVALAAVCLACVLAAVGLGVAALVAKRAPRERVPLARGKAHTGANAAAGHGARRTRTLADAVAPTTRNRMPVGASAPRRAAPTSGRRSSSERAPRR